MSLWDLLGNQLPSSGSTGGTATAEAAELLALDLDMLRGETETIRLTLPAGTDLRNWTDVVFMAKWSVGDADAAAVITKRKGSGAGNATTILVDPDGASAWNVMDVHILPADTVSNANFPSSAWAYQANLYVTATGVVTATNVQPLAQGWLRIGVPAVVA